MAEADRAAYDRGMLAPVGARDRIDVLDVLRGIAILGIFYMNIPFMGGAIVADMGKIRLGGWTPLDQWAWSIVEVVAEGTQRGCLELLFGAGMMILARRAMTPDGPVAVADLYIRRTLWLLVFGLADIFLLLWPGDILHTYALAALFLFPFRRLGPKVLVALGLAWAVFSAVQGGVRYAERVTLVAQVDAAHAAVVAHRPLTADQRVAVRTWNGKVAKIDTLSARDRALAADELKARRGPLTTYAPWLWSSWLTMIWPEEPASVIEALCTMLLGVALYKWGVIQGLRSRGFYLALAVVAYAFGMGARAIAVHEIFWFTPYPKTMWITEEPARLAVSVGHVAFVNFLMQTRAGAALLHPFKAAGRTAFSLYVCETILGMWILFPGFGLGLWNRFGWFGLDVTATVSIAGLLLLANLWSRAFAIGPLEWAWRSLAYGRMQRFRHARAGDPPMVVGP